jgi:hypothetical protein
MPITPQRIVIKHSYESGAVPDINDLVAGEIALNATDNAIFYRSSDGQLVTKDLDFQSSIVNYVNDTFNSSMLQTAEVNNDGDLIFTYLDNSTANLGNVIGPRGEGIGINGVVDYAINLPLPIADGGGVGDVGILPESLNKTGTIFVVRLGIDPENLFGTPPYDSGDPVLYMYNSAEVDPALRWFSTGVLQGPQGEPGSGGGANNITNETTSDGTAALSLSSLNLTSETNPIQFQTPLSYISFKTTMGLGVAPERVPVHNINLPYNAVTSTSIFPINTGTTWELAGSSFTDGFVPDGVTDIIFDNVNYTLNSNSASWRFPSSLVNFTIIDAPSPDDFYNIIADLYYNPQLSLVSSLSPHVVDFSQSSVGPGSGFFSTELQAMIESLIGYNWSVLTVGYNLPDSPWIQMTESGIANKVLIAPMDYIYVTKGDGGDLPDASLIYACNNGSDDPADWFPLTVSSGTAWPSRAGLTEITPGTLYYTYVNTVDNYYLYHVN